MQNTHAPTHAKKRKNCTTRKEDTAKKELENKITAAGPHYRQKSVHCEQNRHQRIGGWRSTPFIQWSRQGRKTDKERVHCAHEFKELHGRLQNSAIAKTSAVQPQHERVKNKT
ncbi:hypothetical protein TRVL_06463 [Trypanosoma vivax]|nr:hypothetical protein TRVL_06463 [Trypanosoma vivax]